MTVSGVSGRADSLIRWGTDGLAFRTEAGQLFLIRTPLVAVPGPFADLEVALAAAKAVKVGDSVQYRATVTNRGPETATGVTLTQSLAPGLSLVSLQSSQGSCIVSDTGLTCSLGTLLAGDSATVTVVATATTEGTKTHTVHVVAAESDADPTNNDAAVDTEVYPIAFCATNVTASVTVAPTHTERSVDNLRVRQTVRLTNGSMQPIAGPVSLVVDGLREGVALVNAHGSTRCAVPLASPYIHVEVGADQVLMPGESATATLEFVRTEARSFSYRPRVLAGSDAR
jgi:uncharacterized repeat protein (TIGR01451 family)